MVYPLSEKVEGITSETKVPKPGNVTSSLSRISPLTISENKSISIFLLREIHTKVHKKNYKKICTNQFLLYLCTPERNKQPKRLTKFLNSSVG